MILLAATNFRRCLHVRNATPSKARTPSATPIPISACALVESPDELDEVEMVDGEEVDVADDVGEDEAAALWIVNSGLG